MGVVGHGRPETYLTFRSLEALGLPHATTTRHCPGTGGPWPGTPVPDATAAALAATGLDVARAAWARQVHGAGVIEVRQGGFAGPGDVLVTVEAGLPLVVFTADCLPLTFYDPVARVLALAHVGWRGTVRGTTQAAVAAALARGARAERLHVTIGPSIGPCCYEVDTPVADAFAAAHGARALDWFKEVRPGHAMLDLWAANEALLAAAGVDAKRIDNPRLCTGCQPERFYSYRQGHRGRLATIAALP